MIPNEYSKYKITVTRNATSQPPTYVAINEVKFFETLESTVNILTGAVATTNTQYAPDTGAENAIDGNEGTFWESNNSTAPKWLMFSMSSPKKVQKIYLSSTAYPGEVPRDFIIEGSNDGANWEILLSVKDWVTAAGGKTDNIFFTKGISGNSKSEDGSIVTVEFYNWDTGQFVGRTTPDVNGDWSFHDFSSLRLLVVHKGPVGVRPQADGPVVASLY